jgi:hypothetical protein
VTDRKPKTKQGDLAYECIDQDLGQNLWRLDDPQSAPEIVDRLQAHLEFCSYCRTLRLIQDRLAPGLKEGDLAINISAAERWGRPAARLTTWLSAAAATAAVVLVFLQAPQPAGNGLVLRSGSAAGITCPVPDEVVHGNRPVIRWDSVDGANKYLVNIIAVQSNYSCTISAENPEVKIPQEQSLPADTRFRVNVQPVPTHLVADGGLNSSFRTGNTSEFAAYRWSCRSTLARMLGWAGLGGLALGVLGLVGLRSKN